MFVQGPSYISSLPYLILETREGCRFLTKLSRISALSLPKIVIYYYSEKFKLWHTNKWRTPSVFCGQFLKVREQDLSYVHEKETDI